MGPKRKIKEGRAGPPIKRKPKVVDRDQRDDDNNPTVLISTTGNGTEEALGNPHSDMDEPQVEGVIKVELDPELDPLLIPHSDQQHLVDHSFSSQMSADPDIDIGDVEVKVLQYPQDELILPEEDESIHDLAHDEDGGLTEEEEMELDPSPTPRTVPNAERAPTHPLIRLVEDFNFPTKEESEDPAKLGKSAYEAAPPPIIMRKEEAANVNVIAARRTGRLLQDGFVQLETDGYQPLSPNFFECFRELRNGSKVDPQGLTISISVQQIWKLDDHLFWTYNASGEEALELLPCIQNVTFGEIQDAIEAFIGGATIEQKTENFWNMLNRLEIDLERKTQGCLIPYIIVADNVDADKDVERTGIDIDNLDITFQLEMKRNALNTQPMEERGIIKCLTYIGFSGSFFCSHIEEAFFNSYNQHYGGEVKAWHIVGGFLYDFVVTKLMTKLGDLGLPPADPIMEYLADCLLHHKFVMMSPFLLEKWGIPFKTVYQKPGDLLVLGSKAIHTGTNLGMNIAKGVKGVASDYHIQNAENFKQCLHPYYIPPTPAAKKRMEEVKTNRSKKLVCGICQRK